MSTKLLEFEQEKLELVRKRLIYTEKCQLLDQIEDELEFVRGKQALIDMGLHVVRGGGTTTTSEERKGQGQGTISLPPRPFEIDDQNSTSLPLGNPTIRKGSTLGGLNRHARKDSDQGSQDGTLPPIDNGDTKGEGEDSLIDRSGSTGGSVVAALGRALTVRRRNNNNTDNTPITDKSKPVNNTTEQEDDEEGEGWMEDKKVKAALDFSKTK